MAAKASDYGAKKKRLTEELGSGKLYPAYLVFGEEAYLRSQDSKMLIDHFGIPRGDMNFSCFRGNEVTAAEIIDAAMTMPFFADKRIILVEDSGFFAAKKRASAEAAEKDKKPDDENSEKAGTGNENGKKLAEFLKEAPDTAHIIFVERDVNRTTSLFKAVDKLGFTLSCDPPSTQLLMKWTAKRFSDNGFQIEQKAVERLLSLVTGGVSNEPRTDMNTLSNEIEKLISYCHGRNAVRLQDVEELCSDSVMDRVFQMVDLMAKNDRAGAVRLYQDMLTLKLNPSTVLSLINSRFNNILLIKELQEQHRSPDEIKNRTGLHPYVIKLSTEWARSFTMERLVHIISTCVQGETSIRRGIMTDVAALEYVIVRCSGPLPEGEK